MILVAGSSNLDFVVRADHIPAPGETVLGRGFDTFPGGKGANQACASARAGGAATRFLTALGNDPFASPIVESLANAGVDVADVRMPDHKTGTAFICVSDDAENAITVAPGANACLSAHHLPSLAGCTHLLMQLEIPLATVQAYAAEARRNHVQVLLNAAPMQPLPPTLFSLVDVLLVNEGELRSMAGQHGTIVQCLERIPVPTVVVTLGAKGCCARHQGQMLFQPGFAVTAVDTTGAGDTFCGVMVASLCQQHDLSTAMRRACAAAALACTRMGAQTSVPDAAEVTAWAAQPTSADSLRDLKAYCGADL